MPKRAPYHVKAFSFSNIPYTVGKDFNSNKAMQIAKLHKQVTGQGCEIRLRGKVVYSI